MRWILVAMLACSAVSAGEATVTDEFILNAPFERVTEWIDSSASKIRESVNVKLVEQKGDVLTLVRENNRGRWVWKQQESVTRTKGSFKYSTSLVESVEGGVQKLDGFALIEEAGGKTRVSATTTAEVEGLRDREVRFDLLSRARRIKKVLQESLE